MLLLHLPDNLSRHGGVEVDCVVPQALSCLVTLSTATLEGFAYTDLRSVAVLGVVLYTVHILSGRKQNVSGKLINVTGKATRTARNCCSVSRVCCAFPIRGGTRWRIISAVILIFISQGRALSKTHRLRGSHMDVLCFRTFFRIALTNLIQRFVYKQTKNWHEDSSHTSSKS